MSETTYSMFRDDPNHIAGSMTINDAVFYFREISDETQQWLDGMPDHIATQCGISRDDVMAGRVSEDPEIIQKLRELMRQVWTRVVSESIVDWSLDRECTVENKLQLSWCVMRKLTERITGASSFGMSDDDFLSAPSAG